MQRRDDSHLRLIESLVLEAGRIMEDAAPDFTRSLSDITVADARIEQLNGIAGEFAALPAAARTLLGRAVPISVARSYPARRPNSRCPHQRRFRRECQQIQLLKVSECDRALSVAQAREPIAARFVALVIAIQSGDCVRRDAG